MPCTFSSVTLRSAEKQKKRNRAKSRQRDKIKDKKKAVFFALSAMGFDVSFEEKNGGKQTLILGKEAGNV